MTDQPISADFLSAPRRRRPRVDPTLLDWKKLTGEENVSVINRTTGKKVQFKIKLIKVSIVFSYLYYSYIIKYYSLISY